MKKPYLLIISILVATLFVGCSDSDKEKEGKFVNPKETAEYKQYGAESLGYAADIKTATKTHYNTHWSKDEVPVIVKKESMGEHYLFDKAGFLTSRTLYLPSAGKLKASSFEEISYDSRFRIAKWIKVVYENKEEGTLANVRKDEYHYDEKAKELIIYKSEGKTEDSLIPIGRVVKPLDDNGRIVAGYEEHHTPVGRANQQALAQRDESPRWSHESVMHESKDKKGNTTIYYLTNRSANLYDPSDPVYFIDNVTNYYEQSVEYYDGTTSEAGKLEQKLEGGGFVAHNLQDFDLLGRVKTMKSTSYIYEELKWDEGGQRVIVGGVGSETTYQFDEKGILENLMYISLNTSTGRLESDTQKSYKRDSKNRITEEIVILYYQGKVAVTYDAIITYNDAAGTATYVRHKTEGDKKTIINDEVYKLAADGTISLNNLDIYETKASKATMSRATPPQDVLTKIEEEIGSKDSDGNWTERWNIRRYFERGAFVKGEIYNYDVQRISYY